jgi:hypothetical protein
MIVNGKLNGEFHLVTPTTIPIASQSFSLNLRSSLSETVNLNYLYAKAHGIDFNLSFIPKDYPGGDKKPFDTETMRGLYAYGLTLGQSGTFWKKQPPDQDD